MVMASTSDLLASKTESPTAFQDPESVPAAIAPMETTESSEQNNNPERYDGDRCMQVIESWPLKQANGNTMGAAMCISSIVRYLWRLERKGEPLAQLDKCQWYLDRLRRYYEQSAPEEDSTHG